MRKKITEIIAIRKKEREDFLKFLKENKTKCRISGNDLVFTKIE